MDIKKYDKQTIFMPLLILAFLLFFIEIAIRRFGLISVIEKLRSVREQKSGEKEEKKKSIEQTYSQLKKVSSIAAKPAKNINQEKQIIQPKRKIEPQNELKKAPDQLQNGRNDRMKRLLDAKKKRER